jgi:hypothetical protein
MGVYVNGPRLLRSGTLSNPWNYQLLAPDLVIMASALDVGDRVQVCYTTAANDLVLEEDITSTLTLAASATSLAVYHNGTRLKRVGSAPADGEFSVSASTVTLGTAAAGADTIIADYITASTDFIMGEHPSGVQNGTNRNFTLGNDVLGTGDLAIYHNGVRLGRVSSTAGVGQYYRRSGKNIYLGIAPASTDTLYADYLKSGEVGFETYTITYTGDGDGYTLTSPTSPVFVPYEYHHFLVDYAVGRLMLAGGHGEAIQVGQAAIAKFMAIVDLANQRSGSMAKVWTSDQVVLS